MVLFGFPIFLSSWAKTYVVVAAATEVKSIRLRTRDQVAAKARRVHLTGERAFDSVEL